MYKYLFGPVPSRRLGMSLGVDLVPKKVCSFDCVYCEVGATTKLTLERKEYILYDKVVKELEHYFENNPDPDYITLSGSGEPTLNARFGDVLHFIKQSKPHIPVAVLTNGSLLFDPQVRKELHGVDLVLPSLDAATALGLKKINRPAAGLSAETYVQGIIDFCREFKGKIWLEVFLLPDYNLNATELAELKKVIAQIQPDSLQLNTLDRPGTVANLHPAKTEELEQIISDWAFPQAVIISAVAKRKTQQAYRNDTESAIMGTIARRPCTLDDLCNILGLHVNEINKYLDVLEADGKIIAKRQERGVFYQPTE